MIGRAAIAAALLYYGSKLVVGSAPVFGEALGLTPLLSGERIVLLPPQGYLEMLGLMSAARLVLTDSGGLQEETTALGVPCLTMRENTERPITVEQGTNTMVGRDREAILSGVSEILAGGGKSGRIPEFWDGRAAERIALAESRPPA